MKIALVALSYRPIHSKALGGIEAFTFKLASEFHNRGHQVTLFGNADSKIPGKVVGITNGQKLMREGWPLADRLFVRKYVTFQLMAMLEALRREDEFDIIHSNLAEWHYAFLLSDLSKKIVVTTHGTYTPKPDMEYILSKYKGPHMVNISQFLIDSVFPKYNPRSLIYNGVNLDEYEYCEKKDDYYLWLGRISPVKATKEALEAAHKADVKLKVVGEADYQDYFDDEVKPLFDKKREFLGPKFGREKIELIRKAKGLIFTTNWPEACPMTILEALSCGTPVIGFDMGAVGELIENNVSGYIVKGGDVSGIAKKMKKVDQIDVRECRKRATKFSLDKMLDAYEAVYQKVINKNKLK